MLSLTKKGSNWNEMFVELKKYKDENNDCNVPQSYNLNPNLFNWTVRQKRQYMLKQRGKPSILSDGRIFKLKELDFDFERQLSNVNKSNWNCMLEMLKKFKEDHGNCNVPLSGHHQPRLSNWVRKQRRQYALQQKGEQSNLTEEKIAALDELGFIWTNKYCALGEVSKPWNAMILQLAAYKEEHGDCRVPRDYAQNPQLGKWVARLKNQYRKQQKGEKSNMTEGKKNKLERLGFVWEIVDDDKQCQAVEEESAAVQLKSDMGDKMFLQLAAYKEEHGDCRVPRDYEQNPQLGEWVARLKNQYRKQQKGEKSNMTEGKKNKLDRLGFVWEIVDEDKQCQAVEKESAAAQSGWEKL